MNVTFYFIFIATLFVFLLIMIFVKEKKVPPPRQPLNLDIFQDGQVVLPNRKRCNLLSIHINRMNTEEDGTYQIACPKNRYIMKIWRSRFEDFSRHYNIMTYLKDVLSIQSRVLYAMEHQFDVIQFHVYQDNYRSVGGMLDILNVSDRLECVLSLTSQVMSIHNKSVLIRYFPLHQVNTSLSSLYKCELSEFPEAVILDKEEDIQEKLLFGTQQTDECSTQGIINPAILDIQNSIHNRIYAFNNCIVPESMIVMSNILMEDTSKGSYESYHASNVLDLDNRPTNSLTSTVTQYNALHADTFGLLRLSRRIFLENSSGTEIPLMHLPGSQFNLISAKTLSELTFVRYNYLFSPFYGVVKLNVNFAHAKESEVLHYLYEKTASLKQFQSLFDVNNDLGKMQMYFYDSQLRKHIAHVIQLNSPLPEQRISINRFHMELQKTRAASYVATRGIVHRADVPISFRVTSAKMWLLSAALFRSAIKLMAQKSMSKDEREMNSRFLKLRKFDYNEDIKLFKLGYLLSMYTWASDIEESYNLLSVKPGQVLQPVKTTIEEKEVLVNNNKDDGINSSVGSLFYTTSKFGYKEVFSSRSAQSYFFEFYVRIIRNWLTGKCLHGFTMQATDIMVTPTISISLASPDICNVLKTIVDSTSTIDLDEERIALEYFKNDGDDYLVHLMARGIEKTNGDENKRNSDDSKYERISSFVGTNHEFLTNKWKKHVENNDPSDLLGYIKSLRQSHLRFSRMFADPFQQHQIYFAVSDDSQSLTLEAFPAIPYCPIASKTSRRLLTGIDLQYFHVGNTKRDKVSRRILALISREIGRFNVMFSQKNTDSETLYLDLMTKIISKGSSVSNYHFLIERTGSFMKEDTSFYDRIKELYINDVLEKSRSSYNVASHGHDDHERIKVNQDINGSPLRDSDDERHQNSKKSKLPNSLIGIAAFLEDQSIIQLTSTDLWGMSALIEVEGQDPLTALQYDKSIMSDISNDILPTLFSTKQLFNRLGKFTPPAFAQQVDVIPSTIANYITERIISSPYFLVSGIHRVNNNTASLLYEASHPSFRVTNNPYPKQADQEYFIRVARDYKKVTRFPRLATFTWEGSSTHMSPLVVRVPSEEYQSLGMETENRAKDENSKKYLENISKAKLFSKLIAKENQYLEQSFATSCILDIANALTIMHEDVNQKSKGIHYTLQIGNIYIARDISSEELEYAADDEDICEAPRKTVNEFFDGDWPGCLRKKHRWGIADRDKSYSEVLNTSRIRCVVDHNERDFLFKDERMTELEMRTYIMAKNVENFSSIALKICRSLNRSNAVIEPLYNWKSHSPALTEKGVVALGSLYVSQWVKRILPIATFSGVSGSTSTTLDVMTARLNELNTLRRRRLTMLKHRIDDLVALLLEEGERRKAVDSSSLFTNSEVNSFREKKEISENTQFFLIYKYFEVYDFIDMLIKVDAMEIWNEKVNNHIMQTEKLHEDSYVKNIDILKRIRQSLFNINEALSFFSSPTIRELIKERYSQMIVKGFCSYDTTNAILRLAPRKTDTQDLKLNQTWGLKDTMKILQREKENLKKSLATVRIALLNFDQYYLEWRSRAPLDIHFQYDSTYLTQMQKLRNDNDVIGLKFFKAYLKNEVMGKKKYYSSCNNYVEYSLLHYHDFVLNNGECKREDVSKTLFQRIYQHNRGIISPSSSFRPHVIIRTKDSHKQETAKDQLYMERSKALFALLEREDLLRKYRSQSSPTVQNLAATILDEKNTTYKQLYLLFLFRLIKLETVANSEEDIRGKKYSKFTRNNNTGDNALTNSSKVLSRHFTEGQKEEAFALLDTIDDEERKHSATFFLDGYIGQGDFMKIYFIIATTLLHSFYFTEVIIQEYLPTITNFPIVTIVVSATAVVVPSRMDFALAFAKTETMRSINRCVNNWTKITGADKLCPQDTSCVRAPFLLQDDFNLLSAKRTICELQYPFITKNKSEISFLPSLSSTAKMYLVHKMKLPASVLDVKMGQCRLVLRDSHRKEDKVQVQDMLYNVLQQRLKDDSQMKEVATLIMKKSLKDKIFTVIPNLNVKDKAVLSNDWTDYLHEIKEEFRLCHDNCTADKVKKYRYIIILSTNTPFTYQSMEVILYELNYALQKYLTKPPQAIPYERKPCGPQESEATPDNQSSNFIRESEQAPGSITDLDQTEESKAKKRSEDQENEDILDEDLYQTPPAQLYTFPQVSGKVITKRIVISNSLLLRDRVFSHTTWGSDPIWKNHIFAVYPISSPMFPDGALLAKESHYITTPGCKPKLYCLIDLIRYFAVIQDTFTANSFLHAIRSNHVQYFSIMTKLVKDGWYNLNTKGSSSLNYRHQCIPIMSLKEKPQFGVKKVLHFSSNLFADALEEKLTELSSRPINCTFDEDDEYIQNLVKLAIVLYRQGMDGYEIVKKLLLFYVDGQMGVDGYHIYLQERTHERNTAVTPQKQSSDMEMMSLQKQYAAKVFYSDEEKNQYTTLTETFAESWKYLEEETAIQNILLNNIQ